MALLALKNFRLPQQIFLTGNVMAECKNRESTRMSELLQQLTP
jgi:hypothetical protein